ncbi:MAG TPA: translation initiation factor IF-2 [Ktedonosporobacter sp.]|nr:translation initiation factor IF-2 [Ktedonosporobacter sp.]
MRDTSELPGGTEQAKPTSTRSRTTARSKPEGTTPGSQEPQTGAQQETKPAARRRTTSTGGTTTSAGNTAAPATPAVTSTRNQHTNEHTPDSSTPATSRPAPARPSEAQRTNAGPAPRSAHSTSAQQQSASPASSSATAAPAQRAGGPVTQRSGAPQTQRPAGAPQRAGGPPNQRPANGNGPNYPPRPAGNNATAPAAPYQRTGANGPYRQGGAPTQQRPATPGYAPNQQGNQSNTPYRPSSRPGGPGAGTGRPGGAGAGRPGGGGGGAGRPGGGQRPNSGRRGPATPSQRPQERRAAAVKEKPTGPVSIPPQIVVKDLADLLHTTPNDIIRHLINHKVFANINQIVEYEKASLVATDMGFEPSQSIMSQAPAVQANDQKLSANEAMIASRHEADSVVIPPVVTIMGHVDHGKTSLLDVIRKTKVAAGEAGGITQHIGAYQVEINGKKITFLDTPGHEAFTAMRARGAQSTHIAIIVVAADDGVMPQTREAIDHAQAAKVPIIIALNKIDKANANPDHVKQQLAEIGIVVEEYGGDIVCVPVSARQGTGIDELLEYILLVAEVQDIRANPNRLATGVIVEARLEKNSGPMATVLVQQGTLRVGDNVVVGSIAGKVRAMVNDKGKRIPKAPPSTPVSIMGLPEVPEAGDHLEVAPDEKTAKQMALKEAEKRRDESMPLGQVNLDTLYMQMQEGKVKELNIVLKTDVQGTAEAIKGSLTKVGEENIKVRLIHEGVGNISETDVHLAAASKAVIIGFNVKADGASQREAQKEGVDIRYYNVIYKLIDDIQAALTGMLEPTFREVIEGHAEVLQTFKSGKTVVIAGCRITDGKLTRSSQARVLRDGKKVHEGKIGSLRRGKDDVREVASGYECGIVLEDFTEFEVGDIIEGFAQERVKPGM